MFKKIAFLSLFLIVGFIPNFGAADKMGAQWVYISIVNLLSLFIHRKEILKQKQTHIIFKIFFLIVIWGLFSSIYSFNKVETIIEGTRLFLIFTSCFNMFFLLKGLNNQTVRQFIIYASPLLLLGECFFVINDFLEFKDYFFELGRQKYIQGIAANINITAFSLVIKIAFCFYLLKQKKYFILKTITSILLFIGFISIYVTGTRGGLLAIFSIFIVYIFVTFIHEKKKFKAKIIDFSFLFIPLFFSVLVSEYFFSENKMNPSYRTKEIYNRGSKSRLRYYKGAFDQIIQSPILGVGLGNWKLYSIAAEKEDMNQYIVPYHAHNDFLQIGAELGIIGFFLYLGVFLFPLYILFFKKSIGQIYSYEVMLISSVIVVLFIDSNLNFPISRPIMQMPLMFVFALTIFLDCRKNEN